jgi:hypothetical protein
MTDAPESIWVTWPQPNATGLAFTAQARLPARRTSYTRTDISQARIDELEEALQIIAKRDGRASDHIACHECSDSSNEAIAALKGEES